MADEASTRTAYRTCPLCEASCGLEITLRPDGKGGEEVQRIRGDRDDVFSKGFICPKGSTLKQLHEDPDRLRSPMVKRDGVHVPVSWDEAWAEIADGLHRVIEQHGRGSLAAYVGNPTAHSLSAMTYNSMLLKGLGTRHRFSASTVDQMPRHVASGYVFGSPVAIPVPDLDRTDYLMILGANPYASNGSVCTAPDFPGRIEAMRARGGKLVVVDPRLSRTAQEADEWLSIRPGTDALLLARSPTPCSPTGLADPGDISPTTSPGWPKCERRARTVHARVRRRGDRARRRDDPRVARELAAAPTAAVYGRIGTTTHRVRIDGLVAGRRRQRAHRQPRSSGRRDVPAAGRRWSHDAGQAGLGPRVQRRPRAQPGQRSSRGDGRVPGRRARRGDRDAGRRPDPGADHRRRQSGAVDPEQHASSTRRSTTSTSWSASTCTSTRPPGTPTSILPPPSQLQRSHYDLRCSSSPCATSPTTHPPVLPLDDGQPDEWEIITKLARSHRAPGSTSTSTPPTMR